ncbi:MAG: LysM peptidoglycan-binding domain-containing protein, partial [Myxococcales bacterium]|nr:LysM peptidoglycan-binding domain-containing protein [Myxococcales bacterium]
LCDEARDPARKPDVHVVSAGESLASIARAYKVTASDLRDWNGLPESAPLEPGLHLRVAGKAAP